MQQPRNEIKRKLAAWFLLSQCHSS
jgi:hypothetical protein